jgi:hypothetical protein
MAKKMLLFLLLFVGERNFAQDNLSGKWSMYLFQENPADSINLNLSIGAPEKNMLYPALLEIKDNEFLGSYELLLVKKNVRQYFISKNKFPLKETPFQLEKCLAYFNGFLELVKDLRGVPQLTLNRMPFSKNSDKNVTEAISSNSHFNVLKNTLQSVPIVFRKINNDIWSDTGTYKILQPEVSPTYFGILDTMSVHNRSGTLAFITNKDNDIISVKLNSINIVDMIDSKKRRPEEEFVLDTGMNLICFFADDFGNRPSCSASFNLTIDRNPKTISFDSPENKDATFIVAKVIYSKEESSLTTFKEGKNLNDFGNEQIQNSVTQNSDSSLNRQSKWIGNIITYSPEITLAIWDDAVDDGDSISLMVNNQWITRSMRVRNKPFFFKVQLEPGNNEITFVADNLGSIAPNTSVLEIIDGKKRKSFNIETDYNKNNIMRIVYEVK